MQRQWLKGCLFSSILLCLWTTTKDGLPVSNVGEVLRAICEKIQKYMKYKIHGGHDHGVQCMLSFEDNMWVTEKKKNKAGLQILLRPAIWPPSRHIIFTMRSWSLWNVQMMILEKKHLMEQKWSSMDTIILKMDFPNVYTIWKTKRLRCEVN